MQIIRPVFMGPDRYSEERFHRGIEPPPECPHCGTDNSLEALGYYCRSVTSLNRGVISIHVRRFRCVICGRTVSVLPAFAQPYRLVVNAIVDQFFHGAIPAGALSWLTLLKQYWNRFSAWIPEVDKLLGPLVERSPPVGDAVEWWRVIVTVFGDLEKITVTLVNRFGITLFGRYRCHTAGS